MLYNGYDSLMEKVINRTADMIAANSKDKLALGYKKAEEYIEFFDGRRDLTSTMESDLERCKNYCSIIESL